MKTAGDIIIDLVERFDVQDPGARRAHGTGTHHNAKVELNEAGKAIFGETDQALVRLSNISTSERVPNWLVNFKGCSVRFDHPLKPIDIIGVNFPYFPFDSPVESMELFYKIHLFLEHKNARRFADILGTGGLYRHLSRIVRWMPVRTDMKHSYYTAQSYGDEHFKMRMDYNTETGRISLYAERDSHLTDYQPETETFLGYIMVDPQPVDKEIKYLDALNAPLGYYPNGEMPLLRHYMYKRSFLGRMQEKRLTRKDVGMLEQVWAEEKYFVLSKSQKIYNEIRELLKEGTEMSVARFKELLDAAYDQKYDEKHVRNYFQHVWGYFKNKADEEEKKQYQELLMTLDPDSVNTFISDLALKYEEPYLLNSTIVKTRGRT